MDNGSDFKKHRRFPAIAIAFTLGCIALFATTIVTLEIMEVPMDYKAPEPNWTNLREQFVENFDADQYSIGELKALREVYPELRQEIDAYIVSYETSVSISVSEERSRSIEESISRSIEAEKSASGSSSSEEETSLDQEEPRG